METLLKADIFFFITAISVIILTILLIASFYYILRILKNTKEVTDKVKKGSDVLAEDLSELRQNIKEEGAKIKHFSNFFESILNRRTRSKSKTKD